mmetsp:Transcript_30939/g.43925  ORF Transcript_30939/g.43925 Transcript_30939/m.43925 type:complete len:121 (+) Transcript_30939:112-474(+)
MTYRARGRSIGEVILAVTFVGFLAGFTLVLCLGNYYRAKKAMERQRQRRLARLAGHPSASPRSHASVSTMQETALFTADAGEMQSLLSTKNKTESLNRRQVQSMEEDLLLKEEDNQKMAL